MLDFYGTLVSEDDEIINRIVSLISKEAGVNNPSKISQLWYNIFLKKLNESYGQKFKTQNDLELESMDEVLHTYQI